MEYNTKYFTEFFLKIKSHPFERKERFTGNISQIPRIEAVKWKAC